MNTILEKTLSALILVVALFNARLLRLLMNPTWDAYYLINCVLIVPFFSLSILGSLGIYKGKKWGYLATYFLILLTTFLSISYIPFLIKIFPVNIRSYVLLIINFLILGTVIYLYKERFSDDKIVRNNSTN